MSSPRPVYGFFLALLTSVLWGALPIFLKICLDAMDAMTITSVRFLVATLIVACVLVTRQQFPNKLLFSRNNLSWMLFAAFMLVLNYVTNVLGLAYLNPETVQVVMQLAPFLLMLGGVVIFKESFTRFQFIGAGVLLGGMALFFHQRLQTLSESATEDTIGMFIIIFAASAWAIYALAQKPLLQTFAPQQLTLLMYSCGFVMLLPFTDFASVAEVNQLQFWALVFCCLNTVIAYGAFTEAMQVWSASKVSAVIATAPIFTYLSMGIAISIAPEQFAHSTLDDLAYVGAIMVILGSIMTSLGKKTR
ncbi:DMT family transporter [Opacimonas viscosa]|uniref:DMT family transporter n=1 Tax=Opacimonas viscosa TaxID=2961944 RepID=A0AA41WWW1_9ALTE|nr:DMT family transporter [Opacimonas viscosa]MCP3428022.1 DMT family transporter [Opacimonas viscosa]